MDINLNIVKKWVGLGLPPTITGITVLILVITTHNIWYAIGGFVATTLLGIIIGGLIIKNPFSQMMEGEGILTIDLSSTGLLQMFISKVNQPYVENKQRGMSDIFDRATVFNLSPPVSAGEVIQNEDGTLTLHLTKEEYNRAKFGMMQYPVLIYNSQIKSLLTKDFLSDQEKISFTEHSIIYQNHKLHDLSDKIRDFGRYIVELTKPADQGGWLQNKWVWIIIIIAAVIMLALFAPSIYNAVKGGVQSAAATLPAQAPSNLITPK